MSLSLLLLFSLSLVSLSLCDDWRILGFLRINGYSRDPGFELDPFEAGSVLGFFLGFFFSPEAFGLDLFLSMRYYCLASTRSRVYAYKSIGFFLVSIIFFLNHFFIPQFLGQLFNYLIRIVWEETDSIF